MISKLFQLFQNSLKTSTYIYIYTHIFICHKIYTYFGTSRNLHFRNDIKSQHWFTF